jgi:protoporphyrinogen oxidase
MERVGTLIVGAGVSGLAAAAALKGRDYLLLEASGEVGGYCKTVQRDGFTWDYSGHFFHFKDPGVEAWLRERMPGQRVRTVQKRSYISYGGQWLDFPFQKNIHQLPKDEFIECLSDLYFARAPGAPKVPERNFQEMLYARYGRGISEKFLVPYNEKLYACALSTLDRDAMGRFFPHADLTDVLRNMRTPDNASYNATFTYPEGGAIQYVRALQSEVPEDRLWLDAPLLGLDLPNRTARTPRGDIRYERLISSAPFPTLLRLAGIPFQPSDYAWNQVLVFNLGFDRKGRTGVHWLYVPDRRRCFYRVGFYDNIFESDRMSLYVELGFPAGVEVDPAAWRDRVLEDLRAEGLVTDHRLVAEHSVVMDPAYVHITTRSLSEVARLKAELRAHGVESMGRYGGWTYCSIEDNILEARRVVEGMQG